MNRLLVLGGVGTAVLLFALRRPPTPAAAITVAPAMASHTFQKGHPAHASAPETIVYVVGAVRHPGLYSVSGDARVNDAIVRAGGLLSAADAAAVNLAERVQDGTEIRVPRVGESTPAPSRSSRARKPKAVAPEGSIDLNAADAQTLGSLPGIGGTLASRIVEYRDINGPFASLDELADVAGMTQRRIDAVSPYLRVGPVR